MKIWQLTAPLSALLFSSTALAFPFPSSDARTAGMGGAGVSSGTAYAPVNNPALAVVARISKELDIYPTASAMLYDVDGLYDSIDEFQLLSQALDADQSSANQTAVDNKLSELADQQVSAEYSSGLVVSVPSRNFGGGFFVLTHTVITAKADVGTGQDLAAAVPVYDAKLSYKGVNVTEMGLAVATKIRKGKLQNLQIGLTPKLNFFNIITGSEELATTDKYPTSGINTLESDFNLDLGLARHFGPMLSVGLSVKNIFPKTYRFSDGQAFRYNPAARAGVTHHANGYRISFDADLTENDIVGYGNKSQVVSLGGELFSRYFSFRMGYRNNLADPDSSSFSIGAGTSGTTFLMDIAVMAGTAETGAALNMGVSF